MNIAFQDFSFFWILFCIAIALGYSYLLYRKESKFSKRIKIGLSIVRGVTVFLLSFFLFSPLITRKQLNYEKPIVLVAQDNSQSILMNKNKEYYQNDYLTSRKEFINKLSEKFEVKDLTIGATLNENKNIDYSENKTNISLLFQEMLNAYKNRNIAAVVLASDGLHNSGVEPASFYRKLESPVFTILMGDSTLQKDLRIIDVVHNEIVYLKNDFVVEIKLNAFDLINNQAKFQIEHKGKVVWTSSENINAENQQINVQAILNASESGLQKFTLKALVLPGEKNIKNNTKDFYIEVIENRQQIALLASSAHPDLTAIKSSIEQNENYKVDLFIADEFSTSQLNKYQLIILHQIPSSFYNPSTLFTAIEKQNIPCWLILGNQTYLDLYNRLPFGLKILNSRSNANEVLAVKQGDFQGFVLSSEWSDLLKELPPLTAAFGNYRQSNAMQNLFVQKIGNTVSDQALLSFGNDGQRKYAVLTGEGLWKWRMQNIRKYGNAELFDEMSSKIVQYLSSKDDKRKFRVSMSNYKLEQRDKVYFYGELYNDSYELINTPDVKMILRDEKNKSFEYVFSKRTNSYELDLGEMSPGEYSYKAETNLGNTKFEATGRFSIMKNNIEEMNTTADFDNLRVLSKLSGAKAFKPNEYNNLADELLNDNRYKTISYEEKKTDEWISLKWIFFIFLSLMTFEWLIRKYNGSY